MPVHHASHSSVYSRELKTAAANKTKLMYSYKNRSWKPLQVNSSTWTNKISKQNGMSCTKIE